MSAAWNGTLAQRTSVAIGVFYLVIGVIGLIVNPDFGTGSDLSASAFVVDWNGWHALLTFALVPPALLGATRPGWAVLFLAYNALANALTAVWALFDKTPLGVLDLPNVSTDVIVHVVIAMLSAAVVLIQLRRTGAPARRATAA